MVSLFWIILFFAGFYVYYFQFLPMLVCYSVTTVPKFWMFLIFLFKKQLFCIDSKQNVGHIRVKPKLRTS